MSTAVALIAVIAGVVLVVSAADVFVDGLLGVGGEAGRCAIRADGGAVRL
jgi:hypothetical protein